MGPIIINLQVRFRQRRLVASSSGGAHLTYNFGDSVFGLPVSLSLTSSDVRSAVQVTEFSHDRRDPGINLLRVYDVHFCCHDFAVGIGFHTASRGRVNGLFLPYPAIPRGLTSPSF